MCVYVRDVKGVGVGGLRVKATAYLTPKGQI